MHSMCSQGARQCTQVALHSAYTGTDLMTKIKCILSKQLNDKSIRDLKAPIGKSRQVLYWDSVVKGFGVRVMNTGVKSFVVQYRTHAGQERRYTIGRWPNWQGPAARAEAKRLLVEIDRGGDPLSEIEAAKAAPTVA